MRAPTRSTASLLERQVATGFLRWFVIQIAAYGLFALAAALLNTRRRFIAVAWAPIVNNIVCIGILVWFGLWAGHGASLASVEQHHTQLILLGLGTSLGVVLQGVALIPSLRRADLGLLRWRWNPRDDALRAVTRLGGWTFGFVLANQIALFVVTILAGSVAGPDPVSSYTYAYAFFQLPYGIVAVTVMSVVTPDLAAAVVHRASDRVLETHDRRPARRPGAHHPVRRRHAAAGQALRGPPARATGTAPRPRRPPPAPRWPCSPSGCPGFCTYLYLVRVLQSMQRTRVAFYLYLVENALNVVLALVLVHPARRARPRALAVDRLQRVGAAGPGRLPPVVRAPGRARASWAPLVRVVIAVVPDGRRRPRGLQPLGVDQRRRPPGPGRRLRLAGGLTFGAVVIWLGRRHDARTAAPGRPVGPDGPDGPDGPVGPGRSATAPDRVPSDPSPGSPTHSPPGRHPSAWTPSPDAVHRSGPNRWPRRSRTDRALKALRGPPWQTPCMPGVHIVTDSACDLTDQLVKEHNVIVVPLSIRFGDEELEDRRQLSPAEFWERCRGKGDLPATAAPSPGAFQAAFQQAADEGADAVLCLTISSKVSGTYGSAVTAADTFTSVPVRVVDTYSLTMGQGLLVIAAAEEAAAGAGLDDLVAATEDRIPRTRIYGVLGGLEHLQRGGRIGGARALLGSLFNIKPVIQLKDGEVAEESKQRTRSKALAYLNDKVRADAPLERLAVADGACDDFADVLAGLSDIATEHPLVSVDLGPVVGTHAGPNTVGVCYIIPARAAGTAG